MGDVTIYLLLECTLLGEPPVDDEAFTFRSTSHVLSADASLAELMGVVAGKLRAPPGRRLTVLDASSHPARVVSPAVRRFTGLAGPTSRTLHDLGWFPSGKLVIFPAPDDADSADDGVSARAEASLLQRFVEWQSRGLRLHEEFAYNRPDGAGADGAASGGDTATAPPSAGVRWTAGGADGAASAASKPSAMFRAVEQRHGGPDAAAVSQRDSQGKDTPKRKPARRTDEERTRRLDALLRNLDAGATRTATAGTARVKRGASRQVRSMLLKSRSEGNENLRMEDRFHLEVARLWDATGVGGAEPEDGDGDRSYRFFSRQATAGRVAGTAASDLGRARAAELLVRHPPPSDDDGDARGAHYRRLPGVMTLHEAQAAGWVREFDTVVVRIYSLDLGPSLSVTDPTAGDDEVTNFVGDEDGMEQDRGDASDDPATETHGGGDNDSTGLSQQTSQLEQSQLILQQKLHAAFNDLDENVSGSSVVKKKKKKKATSKQVRNMLIKSKATGNARLRPEERVHLEVLLFHDTGDAIPSSRSKSFRYFSKQHCVKHVVAVCGSAGSATPVNDGRAELIAPRPPAAAAAPPCYRALPATLTLSKALGEGALEDFGRVMVRIRGEDQVAVCDGQSS